jgi:hypothetical protein
VALRCEIPSFELPETAAYIASRIRTAGGEAAKLFTREAVILIHERSRGIPRTISVMCDNALLSGFALGRQPVDREIVLEVSRDFDLRGEGLGVLETMQAESITNNAVANVAANDEAVPDFGVNGSVPDTDSQVDASRRFSFRGSARRGAELAKQETP